MKTLLLHPDDSPRRGPWTARKWDRIVDLGKSTETTAESWRQLMGCPVVRLQSFRRSVEDLRLVGQILRAGFGLMLDEQGIDWWDLTSLHVHAEVETAVALRRLAAEEDLRGELYATRGGWPAAGLAILLNREVRSYGGAATGNFTSRASRFARTLGKLRPEQWVEIFWDKYDAGFRWRSRIMRPEMRRSAPVVLAPSAYTNVSRGAAEYARLLPEQRFLLVATRRNGLKFDPPENVEVAQLAAYASSDGSEASQMLEKWDQARAQITQAPELALLERAGHLAMIRAWLRAAPSVRDAWRSVLEREPVSSVLCGDDTNWYTRLPVVLARMRKLPTVDFHHGALDGRFLLKNLSSDVYLAKNEMERDYLTRVCGLADDRVVVGSMSYSPSPPLKPRAGRGKNIVFFSEPYESVGGRPEEIYRELLPPVVRLARESGCDIILKLHPFENPGDRTNLVAAALGADAPEIRVVGGAFTRELLDSAWFGITVESSTVLDCTQLGVLCFQCEWLVSTPFDYVQQFARYGIGRLLRSAAEIDDIPRMLAEWEQRVPETARDERPPLAETLRQLLSGRALPVSHQS